MCITDTEWKQNRVIFTDEIVRSIDVTRRIKDATMPSQHICFTYRETANSFHLNAFPLADTCSSVARAISV